MKKMSGEHRSTMKKMAEENGFVVIELMAPNSENDNNLMGSLKNNEKPLDLTLKDGENISRRETYMYDSVFPEFYKLQKELKLKHPFNNHPKIYGSSDFNECAVLRDLSIRGFRLWNKTVSMDVRHMTAVIKEYAKLHSLGMILKKIKPELFEEIRKNLVMPWGDTEEKFRNFNKELGTKLRRSVKSDKVASEKVEAFLSRTSEYYKLYEHTENKITIIHGECWRNDIMFKYEDGAVVPSEVCLLEWQAARVNSPLADLAYFLFTFANREQLNNYKHYFKVYHEVLSDNLKSAGLDVDEIFPHSLLESHFRIYAVSVLIATVLKYKIELGEIDEAPRTSKQEECEKKILDIVLFMTENNLLTI